MRFASEVRRPRGNAWHESIKKFPLFNRTVALDEPPAVKKKGGATAQQQQPMMKPPAINSVRASALSSRQTQESFSDMFDGAAMQGESVNAKIAVLLTQGPMKLKDIQARVHRRSSTIEEALSEVINS